MNELHGYGNKLRERFKDVREESARRLTVGAGLLLRRKLRDQPIDEESRDLQEEDTGEESDHSEESDDTEESDNAEGGGYAGTDDDAEVGRRASENAQRPQHYRCVRRFRCLIIAPARCKENTGQGRACVSLWRRITQSESRVLIRVEPVLVVCVGA